MIDSPMDWRCSERGRRQATKCWRGNAVGGGEGWFLSGFLAQNGSAALTGRGHAAHVQRRAPEWGQIPPEFLYFIPNSCIFLSMAMAGVALASRLRSSEKVL